MSLENREYEVELTVTRHHLFTTFSRSPEEAIADAENMLEDGDNGEIVVTEIEVADAYPTDELSSEDDEEMDDDTD
jgi:hypothetical protein